MCPDILKWMCYEAGVSGAAQQQGQFVQGFAVVVVVIVVVVVVVVGAAAASRVVQGFVVSFVAFVVRRFGGIMGSIDMYLAIGFLRAMYLSIPLKPNLFSDLIHSFKTEPLPISLFNSFNY